LINTNFDSRYKLIAYTACSLKKQIKPRELSETIASACSLKVTYCIQTEFSRCSLSKTFQGKI